MAKIFQGTPVEYRFTAMLPEDILITSSGALPLHPS
jgi:hypothetical protein